jgi:hypothetical protein
MGRLATFFNVPTRIPLRWPMALLIAVCGVLSAAIATPSILAEIAEGRRLALDPITVAGRVVGHDEKTGKTRCKSSARVLYAVAGRPYEVLVIGCGAIPERLPLGSPVPVVHVRTHPDIAQAEVPGASTNRWTLPELAGLWLVVAAIAAASWLMWKQRLSSPGRKNS